MLKRHNKLNEKCLRLLNTNNSIEGKRQIFKDVLAKA